MNTLTCKRLILFLLAAWLPVSTHANGAPDLPPWSVLEFEEQAFWATARSRIELPEPEVDQAHWEFLASSSVPGNSEEVSLRFDPDDGRILERERFSRGKKDRRLKRFAYGEDSVLRERLEPGGESPETPDDWPTTSRREVDYPPSADDVVVTNPYLLLLLAQRLQARGPGAAMEVLVHTDLNFYRARLTSGQGIPVEARFDLDGQGTTSGQRETTAVALRVSPEGELADKDDFSLLGLHGDIILLFDRDLGLPLQVRGEAPRVGSMEIDLKSATLRSPAS